VFFKKTLTQLPSGNDVGFAALMAAGNDVGFTVLIAATVSEGQHRNRASRPQKELNYGIVGQFLKNLSPNFPAATTWGLRRSWRRSSREARPRPG
jgi:hypothetical protein